MPLDGLTLHAIVNELGEKLKNGRIMKIYQPDRYTILLHLRLPGKNERLVISADPMYPRIHTTSERENPLSPPAFCMLLRKYLEPSRILGFEQHGLDRVAILHLEGMSLPGEAGELRLILEIMGRQSNILLVNGEGVIVDALKRRAPADGPVDRILMPGEPYVFPADQGKADPRAITSAELETNLRLALPNQPLWKVLQDSLQGLSRTAAQEIVFRAGLSPTALRSESDEANWKGIEKALGEVVQEATQGKAAVYLSQGQGDFAAYRVFHQPFTDHASIAALVDEFYTTRTEAAELTQLRNSLRRALDKHLARVVKKAELQRETVRNAQHAHTWRRLGELITANLHRITSGSPSAEVVDYEDPELRTVEVQLDPFLTPSENAQAMFRKYTKAKKSLDITLEQLSKTEAEAEYLTEALTHVELATDVATLQEIRLELEREGYLPAPQKRRRVEQPQARPDRYLLPDGSEILVGRNNRQNDALTFKLAAPGDMWFHAQKMPGSHVVLKAQGEPTEESILAAAVLAAKHSQGKDATKVAVDYTRRRHVKKPTGAKPGFVLYDNFQTIIVDPRASIPDLQKAVK
jgi:predicted ribosome quality control (RQC) complex YloA/Tae2 family protein